MESDLDALAWDEQGALVVVDKNLPFLHRKRMFPFTYKDLQGRTGRRLRLSANADENPLCEVELATCAAQGAYEGIMCGLLHNHHTGGTAFPVTPPGDRCVWMTCQHVTGGGTRPGMALATALDVRHRANVSTTKNISFTTDSSPATSPLGQLRAPSSNAPLKMTYPKSADVATVQVDNYSLDPYTKFFVPSHELATGAMVCCIGYPAKVTTEYAMAHFGTKEDYVRYEANCTAEGVTADPASVFVIDQSEAFKRISALDDSGGAYLSEALCAAPGTVEVYGTGVVEHSCSTLPQMSGAPCVLLQQPYKLVGIHIQGGGSVLKNVNYAVSVNERRFISAYVRTAVAALATMPTSVLSLDALTTLHGYLEHHEGTIQQMGLANIVATFRAAHAPAAQ